jgi:hypothetical protein
MAFVAGLQQHGLVEGEIDDVFALHRQDRGVVALRIRSVRGGGLRASGAGCECRQRQHGCQMGFHACSLE